MPTMTKSLEDYIEAIYVLIRKEGAARVRDVAAELCGGFPERRPVASGDDEIEAQPGKLFCHFKTEPAGGAGNERRAAGLEFIKIQHFSAFSDKR